MSMYALNAGIPKTLIPHMLNFYADQYPQNDKIKNIIRDVIDTPISPELIPNESGTISQITEDIIGPYELHDFFIYYMLTYHYSPEKLFRIAQIAFQGKYDDKYILSCMKIFIKRFFSQQFKRSCMPDGPKVLAFLLEATSKCQVIHQVKIG